MAATAALVFAGSNRLRYLITGDAMGGAVTIPNDGGATPDLLTDCLPGPLRQIIRARLDGIGVIAAGALTQAQARALLLSDSVAANVGNTKVPRAICMVTSRVALGGAFVDANVDGGGDPVVAVTVGANELTYLDIVVIGGAGIAQ
jgi:hypothetical protein